MGFSSVILEHATGGSRRNSEPNPQLATPTDTTPVEDVTTITTTTLMRRVSQNAITTIAAVAITIMKMRSATTQNVITSMNVDTIIVAGADVVITTNNQRKRRSCKFRI